MVCKECGEDKKYYSLGMCKKCYHKQYNAQYKSDHREELKQSSKEYYAANLDKQRETRRRYRRAHGSKPASENKQCSWFLGVHIAERVLSKVFKGVKLMPHNHSGFDFLCNKDKKIDVKSSCIRSDKIHSCRWAFRPNKNKIADYFLCLAFDNREDLNPLHIWLIPSGVINHLKNATISKSNLQKWNKYKLDINKVAACCDTMKQTSQKKVT